MNSSHKKLFSSIIGGIVTIAAITAMTILAELVPSFKDWLKSTFSHHWVGKSVLALVTFTVVTFGAIFLPFSVDAKKLQRALEWLLGVMILAAFVIVGFFLAEATK